MVGGDSLLKIKTDPLYFALPDFDSGLRLTIPDILKTIFFMDKTSIKKTELCLPSLINIHQ